MDIRDIECIIAAILTTGSVGSTGTSPELVVSRYAMVLEALRRAGGYTDMQILKQG